MTARYRSRSLGWDVRELNEKAEHADGSWVEPYGIWDTIEHRWVDRWGEPNQDYWATSPDVARMRVRDLNAWIRERSTR